MAKAWESLEVAARKAAQAYESVESASDRLSKKFEKEVELTKELLKARGDLVGLAQLEANVERAKIGMDKAKADALEKDSKSKMEEAQKIKVASQEDDAETERKMKANYDAAKKAEEDHRENMRKIAAFRDTTDTAERAKLAPWYALHYGLTAPDRAYELERVGLEGTEAPQLQYRGFVGRRQERERLRGQQQTLIQQATQEAAQAAGIRSSLVGRGADVEEGEIQRHWFEQAGMGIKPSIRGTTLLGDIESMEALSHGEKISVGQRTQIDVLVALLRQAGNSNAKIGAILKSLFDLGTSHQDKLTMLESELAKIKVKVQSTMNP
jgi:hypothetical protein